MSVSEGTFTALKDMGIDPVLAREAASRYHNIEPAVNWCFGDGMDWTPEPARPAPSSAYSAPYRPRSNEAEGTQVEHREVVDADTPPMTQPSPTRLHPDVGHKPLASNNPFRKLPHLALASNRPPPPLPSRRDLALAPAPSTTPNSVGDVDTTSDVINVDDDEDEELKKAILLSQAESGTDIDLLGPDEDAGENMRRQERERSLRANGPPPPSPEGSVIESVAPLFGPSNKTDEEGKLAMVPSSQKPPMSKEDEDMDRAIQESLMTASFHSASAPKDTNRPKPGPRAEGAPLIFFSEGAQSTYAANFIQAMYAVPQLRDAVASAAVLEHDASHTSKGQQLVDYHKSWSNETTSFLEVDDSLRTLRDGREPGQLPPRAPVVELHSILVDEMKELLPSQPYIANTPEHDLEAITTPTGLNPETALSHSAQAVQTRDQTGDEYEAERDRLFFTEVDDIPTQKSSYVTFRRAQSIAPDIYSHLADILWNPNSNSNRNRSYGADSDRMGQGLVELGDILTVFIDWDYGAPREVWNLEERVVLDRFMKSNAGYAANKRAHQSVMAGNARRVQEKINHLTTYEGNDYHQSITTLIEHLDTTPKSDDAMQNESRKEMKEKLEKILSVLKSKVDEHKLELEQNSEAASKSVFETDDPAYNQHVYILRGILFTDGALVGGNHLFAYVRQDNGTWWKVQEHETSVVEWDVIAGDKTGIWMEGGPYTLIYSREGPRPKPIPTPQAMSKPEPEVSLSASSSTSTLGVSHTPNLDQPQVEEQPPSQGDGDGNGDGPNLIDITMPDPTPISTPPLTSVDTTTGSTTDMEIDPKTGTGVKKQG